MAEVVVYWDASAILSALFRDEHSEFAVRQLSEAVPHLMSSLAWAEVHAMMARVEREPAGERLAEAARSALSMGPWRHLHAVPNGDLVRDLSRKWRLKGADLWHLALAKTLRADLPTIELLSFDQRLAEAALGEGMALPGRDR